jgi:hypothetical protein
MHAFCTLAKKQQEKKKEIIPWNDDKMRLFLFVVALSWNLPLVQLRKGVLGSVD